jgi:hypothetical protein
MASPLYPNATDKEMVDREQAAYEGQPPVNETGTLRAIISGEQTKAESGGAYVHNSGVIMNHDDKPWKFEQPGKK